MVNSNDQLYLRSRLFGNITTQRFLGALNSALHDENPDQRASMLEALSNPIVQHKLNEKQGSIGLSLGLIRGENDSSFLPIPLPSKGSASSWQTQKCLFVLALKVGPSSICDDPGPNCKPPDYWCGRI